MDPKYLPIRYEIVNTIPNNLSSTTPQNTQFLSSYSYPTSFVETLPNPSSTYFSPSLIPDGGQSLLPNHGGRECHHYIVTHEASVVPTVDGWSSNHRFCHPYPVQKMATKATKTPRTRHQTSRPIQLPHRTYHKPFNYSSSRHVSSGYSSRRRPVFPRKSTISPLRGTSKIQHGDLRNRITYANSTHRRNRRKSPKTDDADDVEELNHGIDISFDSSM